MAESPPAPNVPRAVLAGASGVVGRALRAELAAAGWRLTVLTRAGGTATEPPPPSGGEGGGGGDSALFETPHLGPWVRAPPPQGGRGFPGGGASLSSDSPDLLSVPWRPGPAAPTDASEPALIAALDGADALVNLAGASLGEGRLGRAHRARVLQSRLDATDTLARAAARCARPPAVWLQASAVGYYGDTGDDEVREDRAPGASFLSEVCQAWEGRAQTGAAAVGARLVCARLGLVLAPEAPAWQKMLRPLRWGLGGPLGSGRQWWAWIGAPDLARALRHALETPGVRGAINLTAPEPIRQRDLARAVAAALRRPAVLPAPAPLLRLALGRVADELLLPSCRAVPARLLTAGFAFAAGSFEALLPWLLGRGAGGNHHRGTEDTAHTQKL